MIRARRNTVNEFSVEVGKLAKKMGFSSVIVGAIAPIEDNTPYEPPFIAGAHFAGSPEDALLLTGIVMGRAREALHQQVHDMAHFRVNQGSLGADSLEESQPLDYMHDMPTPMAEKDA